MGSKLLLALMVVLLLGAGWLVMRLLIAYVTQD